MFVLNNLVNFEMFPMDDKTVNAIIIGIGTYIGCITDKISFRNT